MAEQVTLGLPARNDRGRSSPVQKRVGGCDAVVGIEVPGQRSLRDAAGVVVEADKRIELMRLKRHLHSPQDGGLISNQIGAEDPERLTYSVV